MASVVAADLPLRAERRSRWSSRPGSGGLLVALMAAASMPAAAQTQTWSGSANTNWGTPANWSGNSVPAIGETAAVTSAAGNQPLVAASDAFTVAQTNVSAGTLTVAGVLTSPVAVSGTGNLQVTAGGAIFGNVTKAGSGTLSNSAAINGQLNAKQGIVNQAGTIVGPSTVSGGVLNLNTGSNLSDTQALTVNGGTVNVNSADIVGPITGIGGLINFGNNVVLTSNVAGSTTFSGDQTGVITTPNAAYLAKAGAGTLTLNGSSTVTGPGRIALSAGTLAAAGGNAIANATNVAVASGATLRLDASETIGALSGVAGGTVALGANTLTLAGMAPGVITFISPTVVAGGGGITVNAPGFTQTISGANMYTGATTVTAGTLRLGASNVIANGSSLVVNGGTLDLANQTETVTGVSLQSGAIAGLGVLTSNTSIDARSGSVLAVLSGLVGLVKTTAGTVSITSANSYVGSTVVAAGTLDVLGSGSLPSTIIQINGGTLNVDAGALPGTANVAVSNAGRLGVSGTIGIATLNQSGGTASSIGTSSITLSGAYTQSGGVTQGTLDINAATFSQSGGGAIIATATTVTSAGAQTLQGGVIAGILDGPGAVTVSGGTTLVSGRIDAASLSVTGGGVLRAGGAALSTSASLAVSNARWELTAPTMLQSLQVGAGGTVDFGVFSGSYRPLMVGSLAGGGSIELNMRVDASGSPSDQLVITSGVVTGTTTVRIRNTDGLGAPATGNGILAIDINGASPANAFVLAAPGFVSVGDYAYTLVKVGDDWYLRSEFRSLFQNGFE